MKKIILAILCFSMAACSSFNVFGGTASADAHSQDAFLELVSYNPAELIDYHPAGFFGTQINYFDYEKMRKDFDLPKLQSSDSWEEKLELVIGYEFERMEAYPDDLDLANHDFYGKYGFDLADLNQSIFMYYQDAAILKGVFDITIIDQAMRTQGYSISEEGKFTIYTSPDKQYQFAVSEKIVLIARSADDLGVMIWQNKHPETSMAEMDEIQQLVRQMHNVHGLTLFSSGDLSAIEFEVEDFYAVVPRLEEYGFKDYDHYREDWTYAIVSFRFNQETELTDLEFNYSFPTEELAESYVPLVNDCLTNTPSLASRYYPLWSDLITLEEVEQMDSIVHAKANTVRTNVLGNAFLTEIFMVFCLLGSSVIDHYVGNSKQPPVFRRLFDKNERVTLTFFVCVLWRLRTQQRRPE